MDFRMFTEALSGNKVAVNVKSVALVYELESPHECRGALMPKCQLVIRDGRAGETVSVVEDFGTVIARLNTVAE